MDRVNPNQPLFSVVTPALNCAKYLERNIESVKSQGFGPEQVEHWIIDGDSTDETVALLKSRTDVRWTSEPDRGLSDAVNKGIQRSSGLWIAWLNADDLFAPGALAAVREHALRFPDVRVFCGDQVILRYDGTQEQVVRGWPYTFDDLLARNPSINQASTFVHRDAVAKVGILDVSILDAMDYEWMVRIAREFRCVYIPQVLSLYQRRAGSIMDAHTASFYRTFRAVRRRYGRSRREPLEWLIAAYLATEPLRRVRWLRRGVRWVKRQTGFEPLHPA